MQRQNSLELTVKMQTVLAGAVMLFVGCHCYVPLPYPVNSDLTSGSLVVAAGSIGIVALAASAALAAMSSSQISKDCDCKTTTTQTTVPVPVTEPGPSCEDLLEAERQKCEQEKDVLEEEIVDAFDLFGRTIRGFCERVPTAGSCVECLEYFEDQATCNAFAPPCVFDNDRGVCSVLDPNY